MLAWWLWFAAIVAIIAARSISPAARRRRACRCASGRRSSSPSTTRRRTLYALDDAEHARADRDDARPRRGHLPHAAAGERGMSVLAIGWADYFKGRDKAYAEALTLEIARNAQRTIEVVNAVLAAMAADGVDLAGVHVASGWRPPAVNDATQNHAEHSKHLSAEACDLADLPDRRLARWALANRKALWDVRRARHGAAAVDADLAAPADRGAGVRALRLYPVERRADRRGAARRGGRLEAHVMQLGTLRCLRNAAGEIEPGSMHVRPIEARADVLAVVPAANEDAFFGPTAA
jgi:hypothetical protein